MKKTIKSIAVVFAVIFLICVIIAVCTRVTDYYKCTSAGVLASDCMAKKYKFEWYIDETSYNIKTGNYECYVKTIGFEPVENFMIYVDLRRNIAYQDTFLKEYFEKLAEDKIYEDIANQWGKEVRIFIHIDNPTLREASQTMYTINTDLSKVLDMEFCDNITLTLTTERDNYKSMYNNIWETVQLLKVKFPQIQSLKVIFAPTDEEKIIFYAEDIRKVTSEVQIKDYIKN